MESHPQRRLSTSGQSLYETLGVQQNAQHDEIRKAYKQMALRFHPDKNAGDPDAAEKFKEIGKAAAILSDPTKRALYDRYGSAGIYLAEQLGDDADALAPYLLLSSPIARGILLATCILTGCFCFGCYCCCCFCNFCCGKCRPKHADGGGFPGEPNQRDYERLGNDSTATTPSVEGTAPRQGDVIDSQPRQPDFVMTSGSQL